MGKAIAAGRYSGKVTAARHTSRICGFPGMAACARGAAAELRRAPADVDAAACERMPGVLKVVRDGNFLAVVREREYQAIKAMRALGAAARWEEKRDAARSRTSLLPCSRASVAGHGDPRRAQAPRTGAEKLEADLHARPIRCTPPSVHPARSRKFEDDALTVWSHTQGVYPDRQAIAEMLRMPPEQRALHPYGRRGLLRSQRRR